MPGNRASGVRLMHDHVNILSAALVTTEAPNEPPHREGLAKSLCQFARTQVRTDVCWHSRQIARCRGRRGADDANALARDRLTERLSRRGGVRAPSEA
jgi:hypothetical protein